MSLNEIQIPEGTVGTPEHVAFEIAKYLVKSERVNADDEQEFLKLYSRCLKATKGLRV